MVTDDDAVAVEVSAVSAVARCKVIALASADDEPCTALAAGALLAMACSMSAESIGSLYIRASASGSPN